MRQTIFILIIAMTAGYIPTVHAQTNYKMEEQLFSAEQKEVLNIIEKMAEGFHNKDIAQILSCYATDGTILFEPGSPITGTESLTLAFQEAFSINPLYEFKGHEVYITGDIATHITPWTMKGTLPDGSKIEQSGLSIAVLKKQQNGDWLIIFDNPHGQRLLEM